MNEAAADLILLVLLGAPIAVGSTLGYRRGARRVVSRLIPLAAGWALGILCALAAFRLGFTWPLGLITPLVLGSVASCAGFWLGRRAAARIAARGSAAPPRAAGRAAGAVLGAAVGACVAASLELALAFAAGYAGGPRAEREASLASSSLSTSPARPSPVSPASSLQPSLAPPPPPLPPASPRPGLVEALLRTANRGFVRHLPIVGPAGDEAEALGYILNTDPEVRARLVRKAGWDRLAELPAVRAAIDDAAVAEEIEEVRRGHVAALYRLQRNPRVIAFFEEEEVRRIVAGTRPTALARELAAMEAERRSRR